MQSNPKVSILIGSDSDIPLIKKTLNVLKDFSVDFEIKILSAHRTPELVKSFIIDSEKTGTEVFIGAAGKAAHLPGVIASYTSFPVIGLPIKSDSLDGLDALLSIVQMPKGIPVATVAINGSENAAILAIQILSIKYEDLKIKLKDFRIEMVKSIEEKNNSIIKNILLD